jgi:hypothetical protein
VRRLFVLRRGSIFVFGWRGVGILGNRGLGMLAFLERQDRLRLDFLDCLLRI